MAHERVPRRPIADLLLGRGGWLVVGALWCAAVGASLFISVLILPAALTVFAVSHALSFLAGLLLMEGLWSLARRDHRVTLAALAAAQQAEQRLGAAQAEAIHLMAAGVPMTITDLDFTTVRANKAYLELVGLEAKEVIGRPCHELHHNCLCESEDCPLERIIEGTREARLDVVLRTRSQVIPCTAIATPLLDHKGRLLGMIEVFCDNRELARTRGELSRVRAEVAKLKHEPMRN